MSHNLNTEAAERPQIGAAHILPSTFRLASAKNLLAHLRKRAIALFYRCSATLRSARGHWKTHTGKGFRAVDLGPALRQLEDGTYQPIGRTTARIECTDRLLAKHPWADVVDLQIFLDGFDAGEQWGRGNLDSELSKLSGS